MPSRNNPVQVHTPRAMQTERGTKCSFYLAVQLTTAASIPMRRHAKSIIIVLVMSMLLRKAPGSRALL
jgi:hypothetical protein